MASEKDSEKKIVKPVNDGSSENAENQFGEASSVDKVTLNNKIICMRSTVKKSKVRILAKLIRHIKQLKQKINGKPVNVEKNKRKHTNLVEEMKVIKALKADTVSRFVLGNTFTFVELNNKGFQSTEARALARFSDEKLLQDIVKKFRAEHSDWKSLAAFVQTQSSGRHIKKKQKKKNKLEKEGTKTNIKAKQAMVSTFLDGKVNNINSVKEDSESESDIKNSHVTDTKSSPQKQKKTVSNKNKQPVCKNLQPIDSEPQVKEKKSNSDVSSGIGAQISKKENQNSKQKHNSPDTNSTTNKLKNSEKELSDDKQTEIPPPQNVGMVVKKINLNNFDEDILINKTPKLEDSAEKLFGNVSNQNTECEFFFINGQESSRAKEEEEEEKKDEEVNQKNDNDSAEFTISGNHSMFLSLSDRDTPSFRGGRGMRGTRGIQGTRGRMNFHSDFKRPNFQRHQNSGRPNNFARGSFSNRGRGEKTSSYPPRKTFNESRDTTSKNTDKPKLSDKNNLSEEKLHPSWEASRKRKEQAASISAFQGKKIKFDD